LWNFVSTSAASSVAGSRMAAAAKACELANERIAFFLRRREGNECGSGVRRCQCREGERQAKRPDVIYFSRAGRRERSPRRFGGDVHFLPARDSVYLAHVFSTRLFLLTKYGIYCQITPTCSPQLLRIGVLFMVFE
jgi:hypothetical protein